MTERQTPNPHLDRYMSFIIRRRALSEDQIESAIHTSLKDQMDIDSENPAVIVALQETIKYHPDSKNIIGVFLSKYYDDAKVEEILSVAEVETKRFSPTGRPGAMSVSEEEAIEKIEQLYRFRTPSGLTEALQLCEDLLKSGKLDDQQKMRLEIRMNQIEDLIQRGAYSTKFPEEVAYTFNLYETPYNSGMWKLALEYVETARDLLVKYIEKDPQKYEHLSDWPEASNIINHCKEMIEVQGFKEKAEEYINSGHWEDAENYFGMYISVFEDDEPVLNKIDRLKEILLVLNNIESVANGTVEASTFPTTELSTWLKALENSAPVLSSSSRYIELISSFKNNLQSAVDQEISRIQNKLDDLPDIHMMSDVKLELDEINKIINSIKMLVSKETTEFNRILQQYRGKKSIYGDYDDARSLMKNDSEKELFESLRIFEDVEREFGKKDELKKLRQKVSETLIQIGRKELSIINSIINLPIIKRTKLYIERADENFTDRELRENETFTNLENLLKLGKAVRISAVLLLVVSVLAFFGYSISANLKENQNATQTAIAFANTPTVTFTPVVITNTPFPTDTPSPTITPTIPPTPYPEASVNAQQPPPFYPSL